MTNISKVSGLGVYGNVAVSSTNDTLDYCLIGEAVAPGFDFS